MNSRELPDKISPKNINNLPKEFRDKLVQAGFNEYKSVNDHENIHTYMLGQYSMTPLTYAAKEGELKLAECLLENGADVDLRDGTHNLTPLMWATWFARNKLARSLLNKGADPTLTGKIPGYSEGTAYQFTKSISYCGFTSLWYTAQKYLGEGNITKTQKTLKWAAPK